MKKPMKYPVKIYTYFVLLLAIASFVALFQIDSIDNYGELIFWCIMAFLSETFVIRLPNGMGLSVGLAIGLAAIVIGGPLMATIVTGVGMLLRVPSIEGKRIHLFKISYIKTIFNVSSASFVIALSGLTYICSGGKVGEFSFWPVLATIVVCVIIDDLIVSRLLAFLTKMSFVKCFVNNSKGLFVNTIAVGSLGIIIALAGIAYGYFAVILFAGPLFLARYSFKLYTDIKKTYMDTIESLNRTMEAKDPYTSGHANRVGIVSIAIAKEMGLSHKSIEKLNISSILHDIGKIGIEDQILNKPSRLTDEEYDKIKMHPVIGSNIIHDVDFLKDISNIVKHHHERYDGKGYPDGLSGDKIPIESCVLAAADMYDAMTSDRPYRRALSYEEAYNEVKRCKATQLHPDVCDAFLKVLDKTKGTFE